MIAIGVTVDAVKGDWCCFSWHLFIILPTVPKESNQEQITHGLFQFACWKEHLLCSIKALPPVCCSYSKWWWSQITGLLWFILSEAIARAVFTVHWRCGKITEDSSSGMKELLSFGLFLFEATNFELLGNQDTQALWSVMFLSKLICISECELILYSIERGKHIKTVAGRRLVWSEYAECIPCWKWPRLTGRTLVWEIFCTDTDNFTIFMYNIRIAFGTSTIN